MFFNIEAQLAAVSFFLRKLLVVPSFEAQLAAVPLSACFRLRHLREQGEESEGGGEEGGGGLL